MSPGKAPGSVEAYIAALPLHSQAIIEEIRARVLAAAPGAIEKIKYGMPTLERDGHGLIYYAAWKAHVALYPVYPGDEAFEAVVGPFRANKDTLRFPLNRPIPLDIVQYVIDRRVAPQA